MTECASAVNFELFYTAYATLISQSETGPFASVTDSHAWFIQQYKRMMTDPETVNWINRLLNTCHQF
jgi:hypothetical protein